MKNNQTQYDRIISALRKAGATGMTTMQLSAAVRSNCIWKRVAELPIWHRIDGKRHYIELSFRVLRGKRVRVYRLVRV